MQEQHHCVVPNGADLEGSAYLVESWRLGDVRDRDDDLAASLEPGEGLNLQAANHIFIMDPW